MQIKKKRHIFLNYNSFFISPEILKVNVLPECSKITYHFTIVSWGYWKLPANMNQCLIQLVVITCRHFFCCSSVRLLLLRSISRKFRFHAPFGYIISIYILPTFSIRKCILFFWLLLHEQEKWKKERCTTNFNFVFLTKKLYQLLRRDVEFPTKLPLAINVLINPLTISWASLSPAPMVELDVIKQRCSPWVVTRAEPTLPAPRSTCRTSGSIAKYSEAKRKKKAKSS